MTFSVNSLDGIQKMDFTADSLSYEPMSRAMQEGKHRQSFHRAHTSLGVAGHWVHMVAVLSPLVIGEVIKDSETRWRATRMAAVGTAVLTEGLYTYRLAQQRAEKEKRELECQR